MSASERAHEQGGGESESGELRRVESSAITEESERNRRGDGGDGYRLEACGPGDAAGCGGRQMIMLGGGLEVACVKRGEGERRGVGDEEAGGGGMEGDKWRGIGSGRGGERERGKEERERGRGGAVDLSGEGFARRFKC